MNNQIIIRVYKKISWYFHENIHNEEKKKKKHNTTHLLTRLEISTGLGF